MINEKSIEITKNLKSDYRLIFFIVVFFLIEAINKSIKVSFPISNGVWLLMSNGFMLLLLIIMFFTIGPVIGRNFKIFVITEYIFILFFLISILYGNVDIGFIINSSVYTLGICIPLAVYVYSINDLSKLYNSLLKVSYFLILILGFALYSMSAKGDANYSMSLSYSLLLPTLFQLNYYFKKGATINLFFFILGFISILLFGARGPLIGIIYCIIISFMFVIRSIPIKITLATVMIVVSGFIYMNFTKIGTSLYGFLEQYGLRSRTLETIVYGSITDNTSRNLLFDYYWQLILEKPIFGWGLQGGWIDSGSGPHNMILEFFLAFGLVGGGILSLFVIVSMFKLFFVKDFDLRNLLIIFSSYNLILFFVMGDFLAKFNLFIFIALCFTKNKKYLEIKGAKNKIRTY